MEYTTITGTGWEQQCLFFVPDNYCTIMYNLCIIIKIYCNFLLV
jgi:hypothetical protein